MPLAEVVNSRLGPKVGSEYQRSRNVWPARPQAIFGDPAPTSLH